VSKIQMRRKRWLEKTRSGKELFVHYFDSSTVPVWS